MAQLIRVLVVDDSALMRKSIKEMLEKDPGIEVIDTARDGREALEKVHALKPDVMTLDLNMPVMDGQKTLVRLMQEHPMPVILLSSITQEDAPLTLELLDLGAYDYVAKPGGTVSLNINQVRDELIAKVRRAHVYRNRIKERTAAPRRKNFQSQTPDGRRLARFVVCIGISTGGPATLFDVLEKVRPPELDTAYLVTQHMPETFTKTLSERLGNLTPVPFLHASSGEAVMGGRGYLAPGSWHMAVNDALRLKMLKDDHHPYYPSADVLFHSVARIYGSRAIGVVLTGIGRDGAEGLLAMREAGAVTVAESEETAVVYGMPMEAKEIGAAQLVLPSYRIGTEIERQLFKLREAHKEQK